MEKKIICTVILFLLIFTAFPTITVAINIRKSTVINNTTDAEIFKEIEETDGSILIADEIIGNIHVKYWEHVYDDIFVVNDSILLHLDIETGHVIKYKKSWTDINDLSLDFKKETFESNNYLKKQLVVFPDEDDCYYFYRFYNSQEYPLVCWEVWYDNGETILYNFIGDKIGYGTPTPSNAFSLSGYDYNPQYPDDPWYNYRKNADVFFQKWCDSTESISLPLLDTVSSYVKDASVQYFYEIAHGDYQNFLINKLWERYYFSIAKKDMENRPPMKFAFIGSCKGMNYVGPNSFSYQFRKGEMNKTVTIGYCNMMQSGWKYAYQWQDYMFKQMDKQKPIYDSFIEACAEYPGIADYVKFVGDEKLIVDTKPRPRMINIYSNPLLLHFFKNYPFLMKIISVKNIFNFSL